MKSRSHFDFKSTIIPAVLSVIVGCYGRIPLVSAQEVSMPDSNSRNSEIYTGREKNAQRREDRA